MIPNRVIIGNRGSGKSVSLETMMFEVADQASILLIDWPGTLADRMLGRFWERGQESRVIVDKARWTDRMPRWAFRPDSLLSDPVARQQANRAATEDLLQACFARRYEKDGTLAPNTHRSAYAALAVLFGIPEDRRPTVDRLQHLFRMNDRVGRWMLDETQDREAAQLFRDADRTAGRSPRQWEYLLGAGGRLLEALAHPTIAGRCGNSLDWMDVVSQRRHYLLGLEGLDAPTATTLAVVACSAAIRAARELFEETGKAHPLVVVLEEAGALGLVTPIITQAMQTLRKHGVSVWVASQTVHDFRDQATFEQLLAMSEHVWHQMASGVERAAADCAAPTYDPNRVLRTEERREVVAYEPTKVTGGSLSGGRTSTKTWSTSFRPVLGSREQHTYDDPRNHEAELQKMLSNLAVGERIVRRQDGTVVKERVPLPPDPWGPFADEEIEVGGKRQSLARHRLDAIYDYLRTSSIYLPPPAWTPPPSPDRSTRTRTPAPATASAPSGMRGS